MTFYYPRYAQPYRHLFINYSTPCALLPDRYCCRPIFPSPAPTVTHYPHCQLPVFTKPLSEIGTCHKLDNLSPSFHVARPENWTEIKYNDPIEYYLTLPEDLFPKARMFKVDPNPIIDEFCKMTTVHFNVEWILDLEFGIPKLPVTRVIPRYDVKLNSIQCKNAPSAIHPGFEKCTKEFQRHIRFYYDCIVSKWYQGFIILKGDESIENFQEWLLIPMQNMGFNWR